MVWPDYKDVEANGWQNDIACSNPPSLYQNVKIYENIFQKVFSLLKELECSGGRLQSLRNGKTLKYPQALTLMISYHTSDPDLV